MRLPYALPLALALLGLATTAQLATAEMPMANSSPSSTGFQMIAARQMQTAAKDVDLRVKPSTQSSKIATLQIGTKVDVMQMVANNTWAEVKYGSKTGYIRADLLK